MRKKRFSEPEEFLLNNWSNARLLEQSMEKISEAYDQVFGEVLDAVHEQHEELDCHAPHATDDYREVGIGKQTWPRRWPNWPSGLYISNIALENLVVEDEDVPKAGVWVDLRAEGQEATQPAELKLREGAKKILGARETKGFSIELKPKRTVGLTYPLPETRRELFDLLLKDNGEGFIELMVEHFEALVGFIPVLDDISANLKRGK